MESGRSFMTQYFSHVKIEIPQNPFSGLLTIQHSTGMRNLTLLRPTNLRNCSFPGCLLVVTTRKRTQQQRVGKSDDDSSRSNNNNRSRLPMTSNLPPLPQSTSFE